MVWRRLTARRWPLWELRRVDGARNQLMTIGWMSWHVGGRSPFDDEQLATLGAQVGWTPDFDAYRARYSPPVPHARVEDDDATPVGTTRIVVEGVTVRYVEHGASVEVTLEGELREGEGGGIPAATSAPPMNKPLRPRALSAVVAALLAACGSVRPPAPAVATPTTAPAPAVAAATPAPVAAPVAAPDPCQADRDACLREGLPALSHALPLLARDPADALSTLRASRSPAARAWAAYLAHHAGDDAAAEAILAELARDGETPTVDEALTGPAARALRLAREHAEQLDALTPLLPCAVFTWDPAVAARAFGPMHGSTRDALMAPFKRRCVDEALDASLSGPARARVASAVEAVARALFRQWPQPPDGTLWTSAAIFAREALTDPLLGVDGDTFEAQDAAARAVVARLAAESPASLARLAAYRRAAEGQVGALASGICAVARDRGRALTAGQCQRRAYAATLAAFTAWVGMRVGME